MTVFFAGRASAWSRLGLLALALGSTGAWAQTGAAAPATIPVADFFKEARFGSPSLSPDGKFLAAVMADDNEGSKLIVIEVANPRNAKVVGQFSDGKVSDARWISEQRLVFNSRLPDQRNRDVASGLWAVDRDGGNYRQLIATEFQSTGSTAIRSQVLDPDWAVIGSVRDGSGDLIVQHSVVSSSFELVRVDLARLDTRTGIKKTILTNPPAGTLGFRLNNKGDPIVAITREDDKETVYLRQGDGTWKLWQQAPDSATGAETPIWVGDGDDLLGLRAYGPDSTKALFHGSRKNWTMDREPLLNVKGYDLDPTLVIDWKTRQVVGLHFVGEAPDSVWFDPGMKAAQAAIDKLLPSTINVIDCALCIGADTFVVTAVSDRQPGAFYLYDVKKQQVTPLASAMPWIQPAQMARRDIQRVKVRDGLEIPTLITLPKGAGKTPLPAVMLVHGGPNVRGTHWTWEPMAQFLASRGYVVLEPEFRGSEGYGFKFYEAGWKQWGLAMQDDVTDVTRWAIDKGLIDAKRICIAGASYGGYATLMGLIKTPELFQCGIDWVGVTDIDMLFTVQWSDTGAQAKRVMKYTIGDRQADKAMFEANSPLHQAAKLKRPLYMAYGGNDVRVPLIHAEKMRDALTAAGNTPEWTFYPDEGHGWHKLKNNVDFWTRVETFLDQHIGTKAAAAAGNAPQ